MACPIQDNDQLNVGLVLGLVVHEGFKYRIFGVTNSKTVEVSIKDVRSSERFERQLLQEMSEEMLDTSLHLQPRVEEEAITSIVENTINTNAFITDEQLIEEFSKDMPDLSQSGKPSSPVLSSQPPCRPDCHFKDPPPMPPPPPPPTVSVVPKSSRFHAMSEEQLSDLQQNSKAKNTHRNTQWGVRTFRGNCCFCTYLLVIFMSFCSSL